MNEYENWNIEWRGYYERMIQKVMEQCVMFGKTEMITGREEKRIKR